MLESFEQALAARRRENGRLRAAGFAVAASLDAVVAGWGERRRRVSRGGHAFTGFGRDLRHAARALAQARTFSTVCVVSLGLGLGAVFAIWLFTSSLTAIPAGIEPERLVEIVIQPRGPLRAQVGNWAIETWSYPDFEDLRDADTGLAAAAWAVDDDILSAPDFAPYPVYSMYVSPGYFEAIRIGAAHGRVLGTDGDDSQPVVMISDRLWVEDLDSDPDILGRVLTVSRVEHVVIGVAPPGFRGHLARRGSRQVDLWLPLSEHALLAPPARARLDRGLDWLRVVGRLDEQTTRLEANGAVAGLMAGLADQYPASNEHRAASVEAYTSIGVNQQIEIAFVTVIFRLLACMVLFVVCLNVAGMVLVRSATREQELAVRQALGASRSRLLGYLMSEALVLAVAGGALSVAVVWAGMATMAWWLGGPLPEAMQLTPLRIVVCVGMSATTTLVFGLLPALRFSRSRLAGALKDDVGGGGWKVGRMHRAAAALQAGIALPFLIMGGLLLDGARETANADLGFEPAGLFAAALSLDASGYDQDEAAIFVRSVQDNLRSAAGVSAVTAADGLPLDYTYRRGRVHTASEEQSSRAQVTRVGARYFDVVDTQLRSGRGITADDMEGSETVAVISESLAQVRFPDRSPLGERVRLQMDSSPGIELTVVGVSEDAVTAQLQTGRPQIFIALAQNPAPRAFVIARATADTDSMTTAFEASIASVDAGFSRPNVVTGPGLVRDGMSDLMQQSTLSAVFAVVALALSALGIYGVVAFMVTSRTREMGVRIALGASRRHVMNTVFWDTCKLIVPGLVIGLLVGNLWVRQTSLVWTPAGTALPLVYALAVAATLAVAVLASLPSAHRAATVEPITAIRSE
jgi:putative ABC transport system permease protein